MHIEDFKVEKWLNPRDAACKYNLGASCVKAITLDELLALGGESRESIEEYIFGTTLHYGAFFGLPRLKNAIAGIFRKADPEKILTTHGGTGANSIVITGMIEKGDNVVAVIPSYQQHYSIPEALGCEVRLLHLNDDWKIDAEALDALVDKHTKLITLTNPNNPTGVYMNADELAPIIEIARKNGAYILCDEIYRGLADEYMPSIIDLYEKGISTGSVSKVYSMAGTRVGWIALNDAATYEILENRRSYDSICNGAFVELIAAIGLENNEKMLARAREIVRRNKKYVDEMLAAQPYMHACGESLTSTMLVKYDYDIPAEDFCTDLYEKSGVLLCHGGCFEEKNSFRIGFGFGDDKMLREGLSLLEEYTAGLRK